MPARGPMLKIDEPILLPEQHPLFADLPADRVATMSELGVRRGYRRGMFIFVEAEPVEAFYCILAGRVKLYTTAPDGRQQILGMFGAGHLLPHTAAFAPGVHGATAEALRDSIVLRFPREAFRRMLDDEPLLVRNLAALLEQRVRVLQDILRNIALYSVPQRVARVLLAEAKEHGAETAEGYRFRFTWTQQDLAQFVGTTRESVSRTLAEFRRSGVLRPGGQGHVLLDPERVREYL